MTKYAASTENFRLNHSRLELVSPSKFFPIKEYVPVGPTYTNHNNRRREPCKVLSTDLICNVLNFGNGIMRITFM